MVLEAVVGVDGREFGLTAIGKRRKRLNVGPLVSHIYDVVSSIGAAT